MATMTNPSSMNATTSTPYCTVLRITRPMSQRP